MKLKRWLLRSLVFVVVLIACAVAAFWIYISIPVARISLTRDRLCTMVFHQWYSGNCVLSCYESGAYVGCVKLHSDILNNPLAVFPGPDGNTAICLSYLDINYLAFTVDFTERKSEGVAIPEKLRETYQEGVDFSNFKVRACTQKEVDFVNDYIKTADLATLANSIRWGSAKPETRDDILRLFSWATVPQYDPALKDVHLQLAPEN